MKKITTLLKFTPAVLFFLMTLISNAGNYGLNLFLSRYLGPVGFAEANILATLVLGISFLGMGIQLTAAKIVANQEEYALGSLKKSIRVAGLFICVTTILFASQIANFLQFENAASLIILFAGLPIYLEMSFFRGMLQGAQRFEKLGQSYVVEMATRALITIALLISLSSFGMASEFVAIGFLVSFVAAYGLTYRKIEKTENTQSIQKDLIQFFGLVIFYEFSQILINNSDIILVKHFFANNDAGLYAALAMVGKISFFITWSMAMVLFPRVIEAAKEGKDYNKLFINSMAAFTVMSIGLVVACLLFSKFIIGISFGEAYLSISSHLWQYTLLSCLFAGSNLIVYFYLSLEKYLPVFISLIAGITQIVLICLYHGSLAQVIIVQIILMTILLVILVSYHMITLYSHNPLAKFKLAIHISQSKS